MEMYLENLLVCSEMYGTATESKIDYDTEGQECLLFRFLSICWPFTLMNTQTPLGML